MTQLQTVQFLAQQKPRVWRNATKTQRHEILATYEQTQSVRKAFAAIKAYRVELSDLTFDSVGSMSIGGRN